MRLGRRGPGPGVSGSPKPSNSTTCIDVPSIAKSASLSDFPRMPSIRMRTRSSWSICSLMSAAIPLISDICAPRKVSPGRDVEGQEAVRCDPVAAMLVGG